MSASTHDEFRRTVWRVSDHRSVVRRPPLRTSGGTLAAPTLRPKKTAGLNEGPWEENDVLQPVENRFDGDGLDDELGDAAVARGGEAFDVSVARQHDDRGKPEVVGEVAQ